jgi:hypothetical protein
MILKIIPFLVAKEGILKLNLIRKFKRLNFVDV